MKVKVYTLNSFAKSENGGNPAGVVLGADLLSESQMRNIAGIIGFSETAFVMESSLADFKVRFFTPNEEVDLCGHATIATFFVLAQERGIQPGRYTQETKAGVLAVEILEDMTVLMDQNAPLFYEIVDKNEVARTLNIPLDALIEDLPVQVVSTGIKDILVPVKSIELLNGIVPDFEGISAVSKNHEVTGYHVFTLETLHRSNAHCRNFAPLYGIPEESATGTSNGALACYLYKYGVLGEDNIHNVVIEQGYSMNKPSEILVSIHAAVNEVDHVKVGGKALELLSTEVEI